MISYESIWLYYSSLTTIAEVEIEVLENWKAWNDLLIY
jgi:hypothetical protein